MLVPLGFYIAFSIGKEKETGMKHLLQKNGMNPIAHFLSWLLKYSLLNLIITFIYTLGLKLVIFTDDSFGLLLIMFFVGFESIFGLIWAVQPFT